MARTVGDFFWERLHQWGVRRVFGYPGDGINGLLGGLAASGTDKIEFVQVRHEEMAAFMASAYAKFTGELGVCIATSGPGASHLITGLYDARLDHMPVLAIAGQQARTALGGHYQQELDLLSMFKDVAGAFVQQASVPPQIRHLIDRAVRIAIGGATGHRPDFPERSAGKAVRGAAAQHGTLIPASAILRRRSALRCRSSSRRRGAECGGKVAILVGAGALHATDEVIAVADKLGAGVAKALLGKAVATRRSSLGHRLNRPARHQAELGYDERVRHPADGRLRLSVFGVPAEGRGRRAECRSTSTPGCSACATRWRSTCQVTAAETLRALLPLLQQKADRSWRQQIETQRRRVVEDDEGARDAKSAIQSTRSAWCGSCRRGCPNGPLSPVIQGPAPTGMPATSAFAEA